MIKNVLTSHILLVEDDESMRYMVESKLLNAGYQVTTAVNGTHAIVVLQSGKKIDLVLSDLRKDK